MELFHYEYIPAVEKGNLGRRLMVLKSLLGLAPHDDPFMKAKETTRPEDLWRAKYDLAQDSQSVLLRERISAEQVVRSFMYTNMREEGRIRCTCALFRLLMAESIPEACTIAYLPPGPFRNRVSARDYERARAAFEVMMPDKLNVGEVRATGIGITRNALGGFLETAKKHILTDGGF